MSAIAVLDSRQPIEDPASFLIKREVSDYIKRLAARQTKDPLQREHFAGDLLLKLIESNYAALRHFNGNSKRYTYLNAIAVKMGIDYRRRIYGRNHGRAQVLVAVPKQVQDRGALAVKAYQLMVHEHLTTDHAYELLCTTTATKPAYGTFLKWTRDFPYSPPKTRYIIEVSCDEEDSGVHLTSPQSQSKAVEKQQLLHCLEKAMKCLEPTQQTILTMIYVEGMRAKDVAQRIGLQESAFRKRLKKILNSLEQHLKLLGVNRNYLDCFS